MTANEINAVENAVRVWVARTHPMLTSLVTEDDVASLSVDMIKAAEDARAKDAEKPQS